MDNVGIYTLPDVGIMAEQTPLLSIVVPTRDEADNVEPLLERIRMALGDVPCEVIFVDDSSDNTPEVIQSLSQSRPLQVRLIARPPERRNGLGKAVVEGMKAAKADWICVMDGDLQHPPEVIPQLMHQAKESDATLVAASRLTDGGGTEGLSLRRKLISYGLAFASKIFFPKRLNAVSDPLTGFFLVNRHAIDPDSLEPEGFKILLEVLVRSPRLQVSEIPFEFAKRHAGESKANSNEAFKLFKQMFRLSLQSQQTFIRFGLVGVTGLGINTLLMALFTDSVHLHYLISAVLATQGSTFWNFLLTEHWVFRERKQKQHQWWRMLGYFGINNAALLLRGPIIVFFVWLGSHYLSANLISLIALMLIRYTVADRLIWRASPNRPKEVLPLSNLSGLSSEDL